MSLQHLLILSYISIIYPLLARFSYVCSGIVSKKNTSKKEIFLFRAYSCSIHYGTKTSTSTNAVFTLVRFIYCNQDVYFSSRSCSPHDQSQ